MIKRLIGRLAMAGDEGRFKTVYCAVCAGWYPVGHGH